MLVAQCGRCGRVLKSWYKLCGDDVRCRLHVLTYAAVWRGSLVTGLVVGTLLTAINQGNRLVEGEVTAFTALEIALTYLVPFAASVSGALGATYVPGGTG